MKRLIKRISVTKPNPQNLAPGKRVDYIEDSKKVSVLIVEVLPKNSYKISIDGATKEVPLSKLRIPEFSSGSNVTWKKNIQNNEVVLNGVVEQQNDEVVKVREVKTGKTYEVMVYDLLKAESKPNNSNSQHANPTIAVISSKAASIDNGQLGAFNCPVVFFESGYTFANTNSAVQAGLKAIALVFYNSYGKGALDRILRDTWAVRWKNEQDETILKLIDNIEKISVFEGRQSEDPAIELFLQAIGTPQEIIHLSSPYQIKRQDLNNRLGLDNDDNELNIDHKFQLLLGLSYRESAFWDEIKLLYNRGNLGSKDTNSFWQFIPYIIEAQKKIYQLSNLVPDDFTIKSGRQENSMWACFKF